MKFFDRPALAHILANGIKELQLQLNDKQQEQLLDYLALLFKWNAVYNLTSVRDPMQMMTHHVLDSLAAVPPSQARTMCWTSGQGADCQA
jgi:16S rRNA (guanine527-N7)-methyltransferase